jgi:hypothetical protein
MLVARHGAEATLLRVAQACADLFGPAVGVERR